MKIIALLFAFVLAGCTGNRLNAETSTIAVAEFDDGRFEALTSTDGRSLSKSSGV